MFQILLTLWIRINHQFCVESTIVFLNLTNHIREKYRVLFKFFIQVGKSSNFYHARLKKL